MLGPRSYSEGESTLVKKPPPFPMDKRKKTSLRKKINSVKSFFADKQRRQGGGLSRYASLPDINVSKDDNLLGVAIRKHSQGGVPLRDKSRFSKNARPRSECLQFIDENSSFTPRLPWMNRSMDDYSPASTISTRSEQHYRPALLLEEDETPPATPTFNLQRTSALESLDMLLGNMTNGIYMDENQNEVPILGKLNENGETPAFNFYNDNNTQQQQQQQQQHQHQLETRKMSTGQTPSIDNLERNLQVRKSKSFQHQKKKEAYPEFLNRHDKYFSAEAEDIRRKKNLPSLEYKDLRFLMEFEARRVLSDCFYDSKVAAKWSKEISGNIRERLRDHTSRNYKIVVNTFIGSVGDCPENEENVHVACRSATDPSTDRFIVAALKSQDLFVAMTLLLLKY